MAGVLATARDAAAQETAPAQPAPQPATPPIAAGQIDLEKDTQSTALADVPVAPAEAPPPPGPSAHIAFRHSGIIVAGGPGHPGHSFCATSAHLPKAPCAVLDVPSFFAWLSAHVSVSVQRA